MSLKKQKWWEVTEVIDGKIVVRLTTTTYRHAAIVAADFRRGGFVASVRPAPKSPAEGNQ